MKMTTKPPSPDEDNKETFWGNNIIRMCVVLMCIFLVNADTVFQDLRWNNLKSIIFIQHRRNYKRRVKYWSRFPFQVLNTIIYIFYSGFLKYLIVNRFSPPNVHNFVMHRNKAQIRPQNFLLLSATVLAGWA
jgi:hypothetical protein